jgi:hypothetical protein
MIDADLVAAERSRSTQACATEQINLAREGGDSTGLPKAGWWVVRAEREAARDSKHRLGRLGPRVAPGGVSRPTVLNPARIDRRGGDAIGVSCEWRVRGSL